MHRSPTSLHRVVALLLMAVMLLVPVADAFACSFEPPSSHHVGVPDKDTHDHDEENGDEPLHGVCVHGHCHHASANTTAAIALQPPVFERLPPPAFQRNLRLQNVSDGLIRPPRI